MKQVDSISIVIPTLNEEENIHELVQRIDEALKKDAIEYEIIFIDDHSKDLTLSKIDELQQRYPVSVFLKKGLKGKAQSLIEGFQYATKKYIAFIDADLQYPPEALPGMLSRACEGIDVVVSDRRGSMNEGLFRRIASTTFHLFFSRILHRLDVDTQSGLKLFRTEIAKKVTVDPSPWTFDLEFLLKARNYGYTIGNYPIVFVDRKAGQSKVVVWKASREIGWNAIKLWIKNIDPFSIPSDKEGSMIGAGVIHKGQKFVVHTTLGHNISAIHTFSPWQKIFFFCVLFGLIIGFAIDPLFVGIGVTTFLTLMYFADNLFSLYLVSKSLRKPPEIESDQDEIESLRDIDLPIYSVLCPLYREAHMLPGFLEAMSALEWPKNKLDILLLLEENDPETIESARQMKLPENVRIIVVPDSSPKTKPKACNYGLNLARGEYVVIYDAEDIPDPQQLKKAYLGFQKVGKSVRCLQAKLNYFNPKQNLLTRLFTAEYSLWFDVMLPGLQSINTSIPLGGTSNHFRTSDLMELEGWDPFNVTEDCDLGVRIFKCGYRTAIIESVTLEEANSDFKNWLRQRSRWIKGYIQTYLVHMRDPIGFYKTSGRHALIFQMVVGGKIISMLINPLLWLITISYFLMRSIVGPTIEALYPPSIFYMAIISLVFGNFLYIYYYMIGTAKRGHFDTIKYVFFVPVYWIMVSIAAFIAAYQLIVKPHYWEKTNHGLHLKKKSVDGIVKKEELQPIAQTDSALQGKGTRPIPFESMFKRFEFWLDTIALPRLKKNVEQYIPEQMSNFVFSQQGIFFLALIFGNFLNFVFNAFLGRMLTFDEIALIVFVNTLWYLATMIIGPYGSTVNHETAYLSGRYGMGSAYPFVRRIIQSGSYLILGVSVLWLLATPKLADYFRIESILPLLFFTPVFFLGFLSFSYQGYLQGSLKFTRVAVVFVFEAAMKLIIAAVLIFFGYRDWAYLAIPLSLFSSAFMGWLMARPYMRFPISVSVEIREAFPFRFFFSSMSTVVTVIIFLSVDIILVKHYLPDVAAGQYALLSLIGKMVFFFGSLPSSFMITLVSHRAGLRQADSKVFHSIFSSVLGLCVVSVFLLGVLGAYTVPFLFGEKSLVIIPYLLEYTLSLAFFTLSNAIVLYHLAKRHYSFVFVTLTAALSLIVGIGAIHQLLSDIVRVILVVCASNFAVLIFLHYFYKEIPFFKRAFVDLADLFKGRKVDLSVIDPEKKKILIINWRDSRHMYAGGAEVYVEEIAKRWVRTGNTVHLFCGNDGKSARHEVRDGIEITRRGGFYLVYFWAFVYYVVRLRKHFDIVIDCHNGIPFFTPLYVRKPIFCLLHHVHQNVFYRYLCRPFAVFACFLEKDMMPYVYKNVRFITVSDSSKNEMKDLGIGRKGISIVHPGVDLSFYVQGNKSEQPTVLYLGRLKAYKSVDILIRAFKRVLQSHPNATLLIAGDGDERENLKKLAFENLKIDKEKIQFLGFVKECIKKELLQSSWMLVQPSSMEGWGIVAIEAGACGTPVIASDVPGLRDSVRNPHSGFLVAYGDVDAFADRISILITDKQLRDQMSDGGREWSARFDWDSASQRLYDIIG